LPLIEIKKVSKSFFGAKALDGMDFVLHPGEVHCLIGENGSGKSTMIKIIAGFYDYDEGELYINNKLYKKITPLEAMREGIQVIYQDFSLFPNLTVAENIIMYDSVGSRSQFVNWKTVKEKATQVIKLIGVDLDIKEMVENLNVAQKQIVAISRALVQEAKLIIMDEPTTALTNKEVNALYDIVDNLNQKGISALFVSHKLDEVMKVSQNVTVIRNGKNVFHGKASEINKEKLIFYMTGKSFEDSRYEYDPTGKRVTMQVENLGLEGLFSGISFELYEGEILGITGLLGCGRTELAEALFGLNPYTEGKIIIEGEPVSIRSVQDAVQCGIGYVPEDRLTEGLHMDQLIGDNAIVCITKQMLNKFRVLDSNLVESRMKETLGKITIAGMEYGKLARALSGGNQQKLVLAKWLASDPSIFILNCPTVGVDVSAKKDIHDIIKNLAQRGISIIVISDDIPELLQICNRMLVMRDGRLADEIITADITLSELEKQIVQTA
jgi:simple sugar transport system ATP-binding protein